MTRYKNLLWGITDVAGTTVKVGVFSIIIREYFCDIAIVREIDFMIDGIALWPLDVSCAQ